MSTLPPPPPRSLHFPFDQPEGWDQTDEGHDSIYSLNPGLIPYDQVARVIYELRLDVLRLSDEVIEASRPTSIPDLGECPNCGVPLGREGHGVEPCITDEMDAAARGE